MACDITTLLSDGRQYSGYSREDVSTMTIALVNRISGSQFTPTELLEQAACFDCLTEEQKQTAQIALICRITDLLD